MSKEVKEWKPNPGCRQCRQADHLFTSHQRIAEHSNTMAKKAVIKRDRTIVELRDALKMAVTALEINCAGTTMSGMEYEAITIGQSILDKLESGCVNDEA